MGGLVSAQTDCCVTFAWHLHGPSSLTGAAATGGISLSIAIAMGGELHLIVPASKPDTIKCKTDTALPPGCVPYRRISIVSVKASITSRS